MRIFFSRRYVALSLKLQLQLIIGDCDLLTWTAAAIHSAVSTLTIALRWVSAVHPE